MAIEDNNSYELTGYQVKDLAQKIRAKADSSSLASVATSGLYADLTGKPTIPTVYNGKLTIKQNGTTVGSFYANQSTNTTVNLTSGSSGPKKLMLRDNGQYRTGMTWRYPAPLAGVTDTRGIDFIDVDEDIALDRGGLAALFMKNHEVVLVTDTQTSPIVGSGNFATVSTATVNTSEYFYPDSPDASEVNSVYFKAEASTEFGNYSVVFSFDQNGGKTYIYEDGAYVLSTAEGLAGNMLDIANSVNYAGQQWHQSTVAIDSVVYREEAANAFEVLYLIDYTPAILNALNTGHKVKLRSFNQDTSSYSGPLMVYSEVTFDSYSVMVNSGSWGDFSSVEEIAIAAMRSSDVTIILSGTKVASSGSSAVTTYMTITNGTVQMS